MTTYQIICLIGVPTISASVVGWFVAKYREIIRSTEALQTGVQAMLRNELRKLYKDAVDKGYATDDEKAEWTNIWKSYHDLGENGVYDRKNEKFMDLPDEPPKDDGKQVSFIRKWLNEDSYLGQRE